MIWHQAGNLRSGLKPQHLPVPFDSGLPQIMINPNLSVPFMIKFAMRTLKGFFNIMQNAFFESTLSITVNQKTQVYWRFQEHILDIERSISQWYLLQCNLELPTINWVSSITFFWWIVFAMNYKVVLFLCWLWHVFHQIMISKQLFFNKVNRLLVQCLVKLQGHSYCMNSDLIVSPWKTIKHWSITSRLRVAVFLFFPVFHLTWFIAFLYLPIHMPTFHTHTLSTPSLVHILITSVPFKWFFVYLYLSIPTPTFNPYSPPHPR